MCFRTITTAFKNIYCYSACVWLCVCICVAQRAALESALPSHLRCVPRLNAGCQLVWQVPFHRWTILLVPTPVTIVTSCWWQRQTLVCWIVFKKPFLLSWFLSWIPNYDQYTNFQTALLNTLCGLDLRLSIWPVHTIIFVLVLLVWTWDGLSLSFGLN